MEKSYLKPLFLVIVLILLYYGLKRPPKQFDFDEELHPTLPSGNGITKEHALHFYELFLDIFLNKHNQFAEHAENVYLLNYILRDDKKWRVTESAIFDMFDITDNDYINKNEFESFADLFPGIRERQMIDSFRMLIDRNVDTKITRVEWINFCNKNLRPKLLQDLQEWEQNHSPLPNPNNITGQFTAKTKEERNHRDLIHGQLNKALTLFHDGFKAFIHHHQNKDKHPIEDPDMFVRRIGYWILERFERWDALYMWIYQLLDDDGNGEITPKEMAQQLSVFGVSNIHVREMFEYFDENGDSIIQRSEYNDFSETLRRLLGNHFK